MKDFLQKQIEARGNRYNFILTSKDFNELDSSLKEDLILAVVQNTNVDLATQSRYGI